MKYDPKMQKQKRKAPVLKVKLQKFFANLKTLIDEQFTSKKKTFRFLALFVFTILFGIEILIILINNSFYTNFSDDLLQYYTIIVDFIQQIKDGTLSVYNLNNYLGASYFSDVYYVPLDIFTFITFLLSYGMPINIAYSVTEFIKIFAGVMAFAYYLSLQGMKNRTIFWMGLFYFISGGMVSFMAFPAFLSLAFYLPFALLVIHWSFKGKKWIVPLFTLALVMYNFYLAYTALIFTGIMFIVEYIKRNDFKFWRFLLDGAIFLGLMVLGLVMSLWILYPSVLFILEDTYRATGSFNPWVVDIFGLELKLFKPEIYIRFLAKMFSEQRPIGFYGFMQDYTKEHVSLYITMTGLSMMFYVYFMKGKISNIYKIIIPIGLILMFFPVFSYVFSGTIDQPYTRWINLYPLVMVMILAHVFDNHGFERIKMKWLTIPIVLLLALDGYLIYYYITKLNELGDFRYEDALTADAWMMGVSAAVLVLILFFGWIKKPKWFRVLFFVEFALSIVFMYSGPFSIRDKIDAFENAYDIDDFLSESIDDDEFYRVYVDLTRFTVERTNFNRMTSFPTNTRIFHSWSDSETDMLAYLLFGSQEHQTKEIIDAQAIYLNQFLGYKYLLANSEYTYYFDSNHYELIRANEKYMLFEIVRAEPFQVYESYVTNSEFIDYRGDNTKVETQKALLQAAIIDEERYQDILDDLNLEEVDLHGMTFTRNLPPKQTISNKETVTISGVTDTTEREFYRFDNEDLKINFDSGGLYIKTNADVNSIGEVFMEFADGTKKSCIVTPDEKHHVKGEFWARPVAVYFETANLPADFNLTLRLEMARNQAAYLVYDVSTINFTRDIGVLYFEMSQELEKVSFVDEDGNEYEGFKNYYYFNTKPVTMYIFKTYNMYTKINDLFNFELKYIYDDLSDYETLTSQSLASDKQLKIDKGNLTLSYTRTSDSAFDQLVVVPIAYSEEWQFVSDTEYETISASGGFLGIIIPDGVNDIEIEMRFVPKGLKYGLLATGGGTLVYLGIFLIPALIKKKKAKDNHPKEMEA
ncbi:MAG: YfhO family protein [Candidatus Izemoplasmatales bacterium]|nr:YfhO family protein [Candidatus Izemoplasmatales bacterium]